jgi:hypothetical protein
MKKWIFISVGIVIIITIVFVFFVPKSLNQTLTSQGTCTDTDTKPFYDCSSYEEYISHRNQAMKQNDETFVSSILGKYSGDTIKAGNSAVSLGGRYLQEGDYTTSMKRLNEALLIDQKNYNVYWIMATWYGRLDRPC